MKHESSQILYLRCLRLLLWTRNLNGHFLRRSSTCWCGFTQHSSDRGGRIWPFRDLFGIFPYDIILTEDEQRAVNGEAVLFDWNRVVNGHGPGSLGHRLFVDPLAPRRPRLPAGPSGRARGTAASVAAGQFVFKAIHCGIAQIFLEKPKLREKKWRRSITTRTVVPSSRSFSCASRPRSRESNIQRETTLFDSHPVTELKVHTSRFHQASFSAVLTRSTNVPASAPPAHDRKKIQKYVYLDINIYTGEHKRRREQSLRGVRIDFPPGNGRKPKWYLSSKESFLFRLLEPWTVPL